MLAHPFKDFRGELLRDSIVIKIAVKASFKSVAVLDVKLSPKDNAGGFLFRTLEVELAGEVAKLVGLLREELGEDSNSEVAVVMQRIVGPVYEDIFLSRVAMHVEKGKDPAVWVCTLLLTFGIGDLGDQLFYSANCWVELLIRVMVLTIKIVSCHIRSIIAYYDPIRVSHRNDFKDTSFPELSCLEAVP